MKYMLILIYLVFFFSCNNDDDQFGGYPNGMSIVDMEIENDCSLDKCSDERVTRLVANNVVGELFFLDNLGEYCVFYPFSSDSSIDFCFCNLPIEFQEEGLEVKFSGDVIDACGYYNPVFPIEEAYMVKLTSIALN